MKLLHASYQDCFVREEINRLNMDVLSALSNVGTQSTEGYEAVKGAVESYLGENLQQNEQLRYLYRFLENLEGAYYTMRSANITIAEVIEKLDSLDQ